MLSIPASVSQLRHLRYLYFQTEWYTTRRLLRLVLPSSLSKLYHIQVLRFDCGFGFLVTFCKDMCDLINLRHLIYHPVYLEIRSIGRLTSLRTLRTFSVRREEGYGLKELRNLNKLGGELCICGLENVESKAEALEANLADKEGLRKLELEWNGSASAEVESEVLEGLCPPKYLGALDIFNYRGLRYPSWMVGEHKGGPKYLKQLTFTCCMQELCPELGGFGTHLRRLTIELCNWVSLPDCMEHLTSLRDFDIHNCMEIQSLPTLPQSLQHFTLDGCNHVLMSSCKITGDPNREKIKHIPEAHIGGCLIRMGVVPGVAGAQVAGAESSEPEIP